MFPAREWREYDHRYRLEADKCKKCGHINFPNRLICPECKTTDFEKITLPKEGKVLTHTVIRIPSPGFEDSSPYVIAIVELTNGVRLTTQIADCTPEDMEKVTRVRMETRKVREDGESGTIAYGYKFVPIL